MTRGSEENAKVQAILDDPSKDVRAKKYENKIKFINQVGGHY